MPKKGNVVTKGLLEALQGKDPKLFDIIRSLDNRIGDIEGLDSLNIIDLISKNILPRSYVPSLTAVTTNPTIGNSTLHGIYAQFGPFVYVEVAYIYGTVGVAAGSGVYLFKLPVEPLTFQAIIPATVYLAGTGTYNGSALFNGDSTVSVLMEEIDAYVAHNVPAAWTATSFVKFTGWYLAKRPL